MTFRCNICESSAVARRVTRDDGAGVLFCAVCGMGVIEEKPASTDPFYADGYYGAGTGEQAGYHDYAFTAAHTQLWVRLMVEALRPQGDRILDVGCATGALLAGLPASFQRFGIEANVSAAEMATGLGITVLGSDVADSRLASGAWGSFDLITSIATFEHVLDFKGALTTCLGALSQGGGLLFEVPLISEVSHNRDWYGGSYEHIYYPTNQGMQHLFDHLPGVHWIGFESSISGFSASYIGFATTDAETFARAAPLFRAMKADSLEELGLAERRLNLAYHVVHGFRPNPERVLALPDLLDVAASPALLRRMCQLWYADSVHALAGPALSPGAEAIIADKEAVITQLTADNAAYIEARDFWKAQADRWEAEYRALAASRTGTLSG